MSERIVLTEQSDAVRITLQDHQELLPGIRVGDHEVCGGHVYLLRTSPSHSALLCHRCQLRVPVPVTATSVGLLHEHFLKLQDQLTSSLR